jgi:hypothetical protein
LTCKDLRENKGNPTHRNLSLLALTKARSMQIIFSSGFDAFAVAGEVCGGVERG